METVIDCPSVDVSVIVATRDRGGFAADAVRSVLAGSVQPREVLVVDQSVRPDPTLERLATARTAVRHIVTTSTGLSRARNLGAAAARGTMLAFLDDDVIADARWLEEVTAVLLRAGDGTVVTGRVLPGEAEVENAIVPATVLGSEAMRYQGRLEVDVLAGGNMGIYRSTFEALDGFDSRLGAGSRWPSAEDNDLGFRLLDSGHAIEFVPAAIVQHRAWRAGRAYPGVRWCYGLGKGGFYAKHAAGGYGVRRAVRDITRRCSRFFSAVWRRPRYAAGELFYAVGVVVGMTRWLVARRRA